MFTAVEDSSPEEHSNIIEVESIIQINGITDLNRIEPYKGSKYLEYNSISYY